VQDVTLRDLDLVEVVGLQDLAQDHEPGHDDRGASGLDSWDEKPLFERHFGQAAELHVDCASRNPMPVCELGVVPIEPEIERCKRGHGASDTDRARRLEAREESTDVAGGRGELGHRRWIRRQKPLCQANAADVKAGGAFDFAARAEDELGRSTADVHQESAVLRGHVRR
jgi:hypothetical protein